MAGRIDEAVGLVDGVNSDFSTPVPYAPGSLIVFRNGQQLKRELDNGWVESDPATGKFALKIPPLPPQAGIPDDPGDVIFAYYDTGESVSVGGAGGGVPHLVSGLHVTPHLRAVGDVKPTTVSVSAEQEMLPRGNAEVVRPTLTDADDLHPSMCESREV